MNKFKSTTTLYLFIIFLLANCFANNYENKLLEKIDKLYNPVKTLYDIDMIVTYNIENTLNYKMKVLRLEAGLQRIEWLKPGIMKGDIGLVCKDTAYFKNAKWYKPDIMSTTSDFLDSSFTWVDLFDNSLNHNFTIKEVIKINGIEEIQVLILVPVKKSSYKGINVYFNVKRNIIEKILFFSSSGEIVKTSIYSDYKYTDKQIISYKMTINHALLKMKTTCIISNIRSTQMNINLFEPEAIGAQRIRTHSDFKSF
jgi:hypothetical protein